MDRTGKKENLERITGVMRSALDGNRSTEDMARLAYQSRTQFHRIFRAVLEETPAAMKRRLLLERAAFQLVLARLKKVDDDLHRIFSDVSKRGTWDDTFVDALCEPAETFTFGGVFAHIMTFNAHRRLMALDGLRRLGVKAEGFGDPMEYELSVAPWNQQLPVKQEQR